MHYVHNYKRTFLEEDKLCSDYVFCVNPGTGIRESEINGGCDSQQEEDEGTRGQPSVPSDQHKGFSS